MIYAPADANSLYPVISMLPGGGAQTTSVAWAAQFLAANGYVVTITKPLIGSSPTSYDLAASSAIDFLFSTSNPYLDRSDLDRVGAAGWSLGGRSLTKTQEQDSRIDAIVAWDNLAMSENGDEGSPLGPTTPNPIRSPQVPALGIASDTNPNQSTSFDAKVSAFEHWRANDIATMQIVLEDINHFTWSALGNPVDQAFSNYFTLAWFDRFLKDDLSATNRLLSQEVNGVDRQTFLSDRFRSAAFLDGYDISDLRASSVPEAPSFLLAFIATALLVRHRGDTSDSPRS